MFCISQHDNIYIGNNNTILNLIFIVTFKIIICFNSLQCAFNLLQIVYINITECLKKSIILLLLMWLGMARWLQSQTVIWEEAPAGATTSRMGDHHLGSKWRILATHTHTCSKLNSKRTPILVTRIGKNHDFIANTQPVCIFHVLYYWHSNISPLLLTLVVFIFNGIVKFFIFE